MPKGEIVGKLVVIDVNPMSTEREYSPGGIFSPKI
jgi:hypothetical protein